MEPDISNMTLNEYLMYQGRHRDLERSCTSSKSVAPVRNRILVYPDSDEEDEEYCSLPPLLPCFQTPQPCATFNSVHHNSHSEVDIDNMTLEKYARYELAIIGAENIRKIEHEVPNSVCEQVEENIDVNTARELEDVQVEDVEMDEDDDIDHSNTEETLQWSLAEDPFLVFLKLNDQSSFLLHTIPSSISNELVHIDAHGVVLGLYLATGKHFKSGLVGYHADDDDGLFFSCGCCSWKLT
ncbi:hypothetical protein Tco_0866641 [Tanacetum coccineum]